MPISIDCHGESHVGQIRPDNEDQFLIADLNKSMRVHQTSLGLSHQTRLFGGSQGKLMLVADGLGGHESGERASTLAVDGVANYVLNAMDWFFRVNENNQEVFEEELKLAFHHTQSILRSEANAIPQRRGMATTLTMAYIDWPNLYVVHVGDTRCYHARGDEISQLTTDHTMAELVAAAERERKPIVDQKSQPRNPGQADNPQADNSMGGALWNVIGGNDKSLDPQITKMKLAKGDTLLLCSDGLTRYTTDEELRSMVQRDRPAALMCKELVELANDRGGKDNITVVVARFIEPCAPIEDIADQAIPISEEKVDTVVLEKGQIFGAEQTMPD